MRRRNHQAEPTPSTRFDSWSPEDLYGALETQLMELTNQADAFQRCDAQQKSQVLALMSTKLQTAQQVVMTLQRRVANGKRYG